MSPTAKSFRFILCTLFFLYSINQCFAYELNGSERQALVIVNTSSQRKIPDTLFGVFFEEINHAGAGGIWAELVSNKGFEAGDPANPNDIAPWSKVGSDAQIKLTKEPTSCFSKNKMALKMEIFCGDPGVETCPDNGVGVSNPGFFGMNFEQGQKYKYTYYRKLVKPAPLNMSFTVQSEDGLVKVTSADTLIQSLEETTWSKVEGVIDITSSIRNGIFSILSNQKGTYWIDQVTLMPVDTYKGLGFRKDLIAMVEDLKPRFFRFPGGCFVEGEHLKNAYRWKETIGPWEERPGHFGDVWNYWTDDGLGYLEYLQLIEALGASPIWVFNNGISHKDQLGPSDVLPYLQDALDGIEFARGNSNTSWGAVRAKLGRKEPFQLEYVAIGNEDCGLDHYQENYMLFHKAIKEAYPDIKIISNCDGSSGPLGHPADLYDFHVYTNAKDLFSMNKQFDDTSRDGPKAFVSEYAVTGNDAGTGSLLASLGEAAFLIGIERNSDAVAMASYAPLFVHADDRRWNPDAIVFNSWQVYGTPSYWMQHFFKESSGATLVDSLFMAQPEGSLVASAIIWQDSTKKQYLKIKVVNFEGVASDLKISVDGHQSFNGAPVESKVTTLTSGNVMDENSFTEPTKVALVTSSVPFSGVDTTFQLSPNSITSIDIPLS